MINDDKMIAWAAGLYEGEGSLFVATQKRYGKEYYYTRMSITSTDLDVLDKFMDVVQCGRLAQKTKQAAHHKDAWNWYCNNTVKTQEIIEAFWPYLGERRRDKAIELGCAPVSQLAEERDLKS